MSIRPTRQGDRGAAAVSLLTVGIILAVAIIAVMAIPLTQASDAKAKSRNAADAAALAGADHVRLELKELLSLRGWLGGWRDYVPLLDGGLAAARTYAERNDATLVAYERPSFDNDWTAYARVEGRTVKGAVTRSDARAKFSLPDCTTKDDPEPTDPPPDDDEDEDEEQPPPPQGWECAGIEFDVPVDGPPRLSLDIIDALFNDSHAKLVD